MKIEFKQLREIKKAEVIELLNHSLVRRHMPLSKDNFGEEEYNAFIADKEKLWTDHGYGPWAFVVNDIVDSFEKFTFGPARKPRD